MALILDGSGNPENTPAAGSLIKDSSTEGFAQDVLEASRTTPVIVDFWAPWCGPCKQLGPTLEKLVTQAAGRVRLVKINVDENQELAMQLRVQSIPMVYGFKDGRPVDGFSGTLAESQIKSFIERLTGTAASPLDEALDQAQAALAAGDVDTAAQIFAEVQQQDPSNVQAIAGMIRCALAAGQTSQARQMADSLPPDIQAASEVAAAITALELAEQGGDHDVAALLAALEANPQDPQARFDAAMACYGAGQREQAIDHLLYLVEHHGAWQEQAARKQLLKYFEALGPSDPLTVSARRRLSTLLFS